MGMLKTLEHNEHAGHIAHSGGHGHGEGPHEGGGHAAPATSPRMAQMAALLVATLAAGLAISEQGAKHAEIKVQANLVAAADTWAQYQAKSVRSTVARDTVLLLSTLEPASSEAVADRRRKVEADLKLDQERYDKDPKDGRDVLAHKAHDFEHARDHALEQTHAYHNGSACMELGIVLSTASAIIGSKMLIWGALSIGVVGGLCSLAGYFKPEWGAF